jgi:hypothetical protein
MKPKTIFRRHHSATRFQIDIFINCPAYSQQQMSYFGVNELEHHDNDIRLRSGRRRLKATR